jgi:hypothetical protein
VGLLLERGADINAEGGYNETALYTAASRGHIEIVRLLLERGADINALCGNNETALHAAASKGHIEIVRLLLEQGATVNAQGGNNETALYAAASGGHIEIVGLLLEQGADVNAQGGYNETALYAAASRGHTENVQILLKKQGYNTLITEKFLESFLKSSNAVQLMNTILAHQADKLNITGEVLVAAAQNKSGLELIGLLLESSVKIPEDYIWVRELRKAGYSYQEVIDLLLEDKDDSPWIFFEPTYLPLLEIQPDQHLPGCKFFLEILGTSPEYWERSQRQLAAQGGYYLIFQATEAWNKKRGIPAKDQALADPPQITHYLDFYWGVQVSCTLKFLWSMIAHGPSF